MVYLSLEIIAVNHDISMLFLRPCTVFSMAICICCFQLQTYRLSFTKDKFHTCLNFTWYFIEISCYVPAHMYYRT
ncbi:hypothetical protein EB796_008397 [Bugula neritina]|uniref:Uncharacterized protein n=1 Tax=Bugula neritina TaxID=10212 RepID=A0A7J7K6W4_BUGNE|nr:hypothetical protein EB796_008397 [Bugula neritina]